MVINVSLWVGIHSYRRWRKLRRVKTCEKEDICQLLFCHCFCKRNSFFILYEIEINICENYTYIFKINIFKFLRHFELVYKLTQIQEWHEGQNEIYLRFLFSIRYTLRDSPETNVRYAWLEAIVKNEQWHLANDLI